MVNFTQPVGADEISHEERIKDLGGDIEVLCKEVSEMDAIMVSMEDETGYRDSSGSNYKLLYKYCPMTPPSVPQLLHTKTCLPLSPATYESG